MAQKRNKIKIRLGPLNFEPSTYDEAQSAIAQILTDTLSRIEIVDDDGNTLKLGSSTVADYHPRYNVFKCKELADFVKYAQNKSYKPARFKAVFNQLCLIAASDGKYSGYADSVSSDLEKLIQGKYVTYRTVVEMRGINRKRQRKTRINYYSPTQKGWDYITETREAPLKSLPTEFIYQMLKYCIGRDAEGKMKPDLAAMRATACVTQERPETSVFDPIYDQYEAENFTSRPLYLTPRAETVATKLITKTIQNHVWPRWNRDYKSKTRTLIMPSALDRTLVALAPKSEYAILLTTQNRGSYYKAILENTLTPSIESFI